MRCLAIAFLSFAIAASAQDKPKEQPAESKSSTKKLTTEELEKLLEKRENLFFLDVREPDEIAKLGSVEGYVNIPLGQLEKRLNELPKDKLIVTL